MDDSERPGRSFVDRARAAISGVEQDERVKQAASVTREAAARTQEASRSLSRKITQEDAWEELRADVEQLTEVARAHHALIVDLLERIEALEAGLAGGSPSRYGD